MTMPKDPRVRSLDARKLFERSFNLNYYNF